MKRFIFSALMAVMTAGLTTQCASGHASEKSYGEEAAARNVIERKLAIKKPFNAIDVKGGVPVYYTVGAANTVRIVGVEDMVENTVVTVEDETLTLYLDRDKLGRVYFNSGYAVYVTAPAFNNIKISLGSCFIMETAMTVANDFNLKGSAGAIFKADKGLTCGEITLKPTTGMVVDIKDLKAGTANVSPSSGSIVTLVGSVTTLNAHISSGAIANLTELKAEKGDVHASSGAIANINKGSLSVHSSSGALVHTK